MTDTTVHHAGPEATIGTRPSLLKVVRDQRKTIVVALAWWSPRSGLGQLGRWALADASPCGVVLGLLNHLATELWLLKLISSGREAHAQQDDRLDASSGWWSSPWWLSPSP